MARSRVKSRFWYGALLVVVVLIAIRLALPYAGLWMINKELDEKLGAYTGHLNDLELSLYRGVYELKGLEIKKRDSRLPPLLTIGSIAIALDWRALFDRILATDIWIDDLKLHLNDSHTKEKRELGLEEEKEVWLHEINRLMPLRINSLSVDDSAVYFTNLDLRRPMPLRLEKITFRIEDLRTRKRGTPNPFSFKAHLQGHAKVAANGEFDFLAHRPAGKMRFELLHFQPSSVNKLLLAYVPVDIAAGDLSIYSEIAALNGEAAGYLKIFFNNGQIRKVNEKYISTPHFFIELATAFGNWLLQNSSTKNVAAYLPIDYRAGHLNINASEAFWSSIQNKWDSLKPGFDGTVSIDTVKQEQRKRD